jgi:hypothetical protein
MNAGLEVLIVLSERVSKQCDLVGDEGSGLRTCCKVSLAKSRR